MNVHLHALAREHVVVEHPPLRSLRAIRQRLLIRVPVQGQKAHDLGNLRAFHEDVEIRDLSKGHIAVGGQSQRRALERRRRDAV